MNGDDKEPIPGLDDIPATEPAAETVTEMPVAETEEIEEQTVPISVNKKKKGLNPFIEITNKEKVLPYVTSQSPRKNHFKFKNINDQNNLAAALGDQYTIEFSEVRSRPHMAIYKKNNTNNQTNNQTKDIIGKVHFLYHDEKTPDNKYIKLYLYNFTDNEIQAEIEAKLKNFFENFKPVGAASATADAATNAGPTGGGKRRVRHRKTMKKRHTSKRHARRKTRARR
jgi:hypothetical protein